MSGTKYITNWSQVKLILNLNEVAFLSELSVLIPKIYEDRVLGKIPEEVCIDLLEKYQAEQKELTVAVSELEAKSGAIFTATELSELTILNFSLRATSHATHSRQKNLMPPNQIKRF